MSEDYVKLVEFVGLNDWTRIPPSERTVEELSAFVRVEPTEHIVGREYAYGIKVIEGLYNEIAERLIRLSKENERLKVTLKSMENNYTRDVRKE